MKGPSQTSAVAAVSFAIALAACGGGGGGLGSGTVSQSGNFNLQAGITNMVAHGLAANVVLSGSTSVNGVATAITGSGTYARPPAVSATFNGGAALSQTESISGTVSAAGQSIPYSTSVLDYYSTGTSAFLGEDTGKEFDVAQTPFEYPAMIVGGSAGILGTVSRYTDRSLSVSLGTAQVSYTVQAPANAASPIGITVTTRIYDTGSTLKETDMTNFNMTSLDVISFVSASVQNQSGTLTITAR